MIVKGHWESEEPQVLGKEFRVGLHHQMALTRLPTTSLITYRRLFSASVF